ncbi:MAG: hypothetical protein K8U57_19650 [Planctomycetes bacterium]|nr:hypothetical protein [Planctomycetota bacterium]
MTLPTADDVERGVVLVGKRLDVKEGERVAVVPGVRHRNTLRLWVKSVARLEGAKMSKNALTEWEERFRAAVNQHQAPWGSKWFYCTNDAHLVYVGNNTACPACHAPMVSAIIEGSGVVVRCTQCLCQTRVIPGGELGEMPFGPFVAELLDFEWAGLPAVS